MTTEPILSDSPADLADLNRTIAVLDIVAHLNEHHGYTIPEGHPKTEHGFRRLHVEHAAIHAERISQEHMEEGR